MLPTNQSSAAQGMSPSTRASSSESGSSSDSPGGAIRLVVRSIDYRTTVITARAHDTVITARAHDTVITARAHDTVITARAQDTVGELLGRLGDVGRRSDMHVVHAGRELPLEATVGELHLPRDAKLIATPRPDPWIIATQITAAATAARPVSRETANIVEDHDDNGTLLASAIPDLRALYCMSPSAVATMLASRDAVEHVKKLLDDADNLHKQAPYRADMIGEHNDGFPRSGVAGFLVRLYLSDYEPCRTRAKEAIRSFLFPDSMTQMRRNVEAWTAPVYLEFCRSIAAGAGAGKSDPLYKACRSRLAKVFSLRDRLPPPHSPELPRAWVIEQLAPFAQETADELIGDIAGGRTRPTGKLFEFRVFFSVLCKEVRALRAGSSPDSGAGATAWQIAALSETAMSLLRAVDGFMAKVARSPSPSSSPSSEQLGWATTGTVNSIWVVLTTLDSWPETHGHVAHAMRATLTARAASLNALVLCTSATRSRCGDILRVVARHKDLLGFEARRHLATAMLPELDAPPHSVFIAPPELPEPHEMLIDRFRLLTDSFGYVVHAARGELHTGLLMEFLNEEAIGDGAVREWLALVCRALFNPQQVLFSPCPRDRRRFFLNPASAVNPLHLDYFNFAGRIIGLALMHNVQVGVSFDRTLFLQLAGKPITLDDIADADPCMHASCRKILEMDPDLVDSDALGLTFAHEVGAFGSREVIELIPGGKDVAVDCKNRCQYIDLLIQDIFVNSAKNQLAHFAEGFSCMLVKSELQRAFFQSLDLEDLDLMLGGRKSPIDVEEWKKHTIYMGYSQEDDQIKWFWKAVESMTDEQQRRLLFFWTAVQYLPFDGFDGLDCCLLISRAPSATPDHLPSSSTCTYRLNLPCYTSFSMTQVRLQIIAQEHVSSSFGEI